MAQPVATTPPIQIQVVFPAVAAVAATELSALAALARLKSLFGDPYELRNHQLYWPCR
jgi:hypothetical protein